MHGTFAFDLDYAPRSVRQNRIEAVRMSKWNDKEGGQQYVTDTGASHDLQRLTFRAPQPRSECSGPKINGAEMKSVTRSSRAIAVHYCGGGSRCSILRLSAR